MCFHTSVWHEPEYWEKEFKVKLADESLRPYFKQPHYHHNGFSHPNMQVIPQENSAVLAPGVWGIVPKDRTVQEIKPYYRESVTYGSGLNARSEKIFQHFLYRESIMEKRCIIPVSGFFEPHEHDGKKYPFYFKEKENKPLALAGLYTLIGTYITFTILTREASPLFAKIHNKKKRQPLILDADHVHNWLSMDLTQTDITNITNYSFPEERLDAYSVSKDLFSPKENSDMARIIEKVEFQELLS